MTSGQERGFMIFVGSVDTISGWIIAFQGNPIISPSESAWINGLPWTGMLLA
jgi:hypothetical protein